MYKNIRDISYILRALFAYWVIDNSPIAKADLLNEIIWQVIPTYTILMIISYAITGLFYHSGRREPTLGSFIYFVIYCTLLSVMWIILKILTVFGVLPI